MLRIGFTRRILRSALSLECRSWTSSTCAPTPNSPSSTAPCASTTWWPRRAADGQGALAITDLSNLFGAVKFYSAARKKGVKPIIGADVWLEPESGDKQPSRLLLLVQNRAGYLNLCELLSRAWLRERAARPGLGALGLAGRAWRGADRAVGRRSRRGRPGAAGRRRRARARGGARGWRRCSRGRFYIELQRAGLPGHEAHVRAAVPLAAELRPAGGGDAPGAVPRRRTTSRPTRRASASPKARR